MACGISSTLTQAEASLTQWITTLGKSGNFLQRSEAKFSFGCNGRIKDFFQNGYKMGLKITFFLKLQDPLDINLCLLHSSHWKNPARKGGFSKLELLQGMWIPLNFYFNIN